MEGAVNSLYYLKEFQQKGKVNNSNIQRKINFLAVVFFLSCSRILAQDDWVWQNPLPHNSTFRGVVALNTTTAIAVGEAG